MREREATLEELHDWSADCRQRSFAMLADLEEEQLSVPYLPSLNPFHWELGHAIWFQEYWVLRQGLGRSSLWPEADRYFDSTHVGHERRWHLDLPDRERLREWGQRVLDAVQSLLAEGEPSRELRDAVLYSIDHEDMHAEAFTYMRQTLGYRPPAELGPRSIAEFPREPADGDVEISGGTYPLGASPDEPFTHDNERWMHSSEIGPFRIARTAVSQGQFADFVDDGGYRRPELWSREGWGWRQGMGAERPVYWRGSEGAWQRRFFDEWRDLDPDLPMIHLSFFEADAWCRWAGRRLPKEAEWEVAAMANPPGNGSEQGSRRRRPWGDEPDRDPTRANLDGAAGGPLPVDALPAGDTPSGVRQMLGNVWEWTASDFLPYPGFETEPYEQYSEPWFGCRKSLRGGSWITRSRLLRTTWRNYFTPDRRDVFAGFRTCALDP